MMSLFSFVLRLLLLTAGLLFAFSLALAAMVVLVWWGLRVLWAKLTGRPIQPFVMRFDPRGGFGRVFHGAAGTPRATPPSPSAPTLRDVTDVEPKSPRD